MNPPHLPALLSLSLLETAHHTRRHSTSNSHRFTATGRLPPSPCLSLGSLNRVLASRISSLFSVCAVCLALVSRRASAGECSIWASNSYVACRQCPCQSTERLVCSTARVLPLFLQSCFLVNAPSRALRLRPSLYSISWLLILELLLIVHLLPLQQQISICSGGTWDAEKLADELWFQLNTLRVTPTKLVIGHENTLSQLFSTSFEVYSPPLNHKSSVFDNSSSCISSATTKNNFGLIRLQCSPEKDVNDQSYDVFASYVENFYRILRKYHSRVPKLELTLKESGILNRRSDAGNLAYRFYAWASKQSDYQHSQEVYKAMIKVLGKIQQFGAVWALIEEMRQENPMLISPQMFVILMRKFASTRMVQKAIEVLDEMPNYRYEPDEYIFRCLLDVLCKNGCIKEAASLFEDMRYRFPPTIKNFTFLLYGWCREGKLVEAKHVLVQMKDAGIEPDIVVYNNLLSGYALAAKMEDAYDLLKDMRRIGCGPNTTSYTILIQSLCKHEKLEDGMRRFCKWEKVERGYELLDRMIQQGIVPNQLTYHHLMLAHEKKEKLEECMELVNEMHKIGSTPDLNIYNTVIRLACKLGEIKEGVRL
ncbi:putative pentatricopeptide repeat-containing protein At5g65820 [Arachis duranensis]|uniref:Pentatricopeptide repeat-containing protein At5g65820 n=1 Tax=Arachis duranensis TaxID=130453 RepID=A0A9C6TBL6_ARADU|nr:putative pentatricopeptide repeat-containing protein At5g65820 [Arachis duranensis]